MPDFPCSYFHPSIFSFFFPELMILTKTSTFSTGKKKQNTLELCPERESIQHYLVSYSLAAWRIIAIIWGFGST